MHYIIRTLLPAFSVPPTHSPCPQRIYPYPYSALLVPSLPPRRVYRGSQPGKRPLLGTNRTLSALFVPIKCVVRTLRALCVPLKCIVRTLRALFVPLQCIVRTLSALFVPLQCTKRALSALFVPLKCIVCTVNGTICTHIVHCSYRYPQLPPSGLPRQPARQARVGERRLVGARARRRHLRRPRGPQWPAGEYPESTP